jgi:hypothetical protein
MKVSIPPNIVYHRIEDEVVILNVRDNSYFTLNLTAGVFWESLSSSGDVEAAIQSVRDKFPSESDSIEEDLSTLLSELLQEQLLNKV